jgi:hypothetical protein
MKVANFETHIKAMKSHYQGNIFLKYPLPVSVVNSYEIYNLANGTGDFDLDLKIGLQNAQTDIKQDVNQSSDDISESVEKLGKHPSPQSLGEFQKAMEERRKQAIQTATSRINQTFDKFERIGKDYPEYQDTIISTVDKIGSFINFLWDEIGNFIGKLIDNIMSFVKEAWKEVKSYFLNKIQSVTKFFGAFTLNLNSLGVQSTLYNQINEFAKTVEKQIKIGKELTINYDYPGVKDEIENEFLQESVNISSGTKKIIPEVVRRILMMNEKKLLIGSFTITSNIWLLMHYNYEVTIDTDRSLFSLRPANTSPLGWIEPSLSVPLG